VRLDIPVHDALAMTEIQRLEKLIDIIPNIVVDEAWIEGPEVGIVHVFKYETRCLALTVANHVQ
jgi:hypothetical protein